MPIQEPGRLRGRVLAVLLLFAGTAAAAPSSYLGRPVVGHRVVQSWPHDPTSFTQGLVIEAGVLYEGTGLYGRSRLLRIDLESGAVLAARRLPERYFGEGIALVGEQIVQLTWRARVGFVYDKRSLRVERNFRYETEGWGLTWDGHRLIKSDGSATLEHLDPVTFEVTGRCQVSASGHPVMRLNELEMVAGLLYANIWRSDYIARIDPVSCKVRDWIDLSELSQRFGASVDVLNGIAWDASSKRLFVTGKLWPRLFEIVVQEPDD